MNQIFLHWPEQMISFYVKSYKRDSKKNSCKDLACLQIVFDISSDYITNYWGKDKVKISQQNQTIILLLFQRQERI